MRGRAKRREKREKGKGKREKGKGKREKTREHWERSRKENGLRAATHIRQIWRMHGC
jgi:hypothetical protein